MTIHRLPIYLITDLDKLLVRLGIEFARIKQS